MNRGSRFEIANRGKLGAVRISPDGTKLAMISAADRTTRLPVG